MTTEAGQPLVTIVVPAYNSEKYIAQTIESVLAQNVKEWELIVVDDGSKDNTRQIVEKYMRKDSRIILLTQKANLGVSIARNKGLQLAKGVYISFLDSDDVYRKDYIEKMLQTYQQHSKVSIVFCGYKHFQTPQEIAKLDSKGVTGRFVNFIKHISKVKGAYVGMAFMYKKSVLKSKSLIFHEQTNNFEDIEFILKATYSEKVAYIPTPLYFYRKHAESVSSQPIQRKQIISVISACRRLRDFFLYKKDNAYGSYVEHLESSYNNYVKRYIWELILARRFEEAESVLNVYSRDLKQPFNVKSQGVKKVLNYPKLKIIKTRNYKVWEFARSYLHFL